jgi:integrase
MASLRKRGRVWYYRFTDADGVKREWPGCPDRRATEELARKAETEAAQVRAGLYDPKELAYRRHAAHPLSEHLNEYESDMRARNNTAHYAQLHSDRARRVAALVCGGRLVDFDPPKTADKADRARADARRAEILGRGRLADLTLSKVQDALGALWAAGRSLQTLNHHRAAVRGFVIWARKDGRLRNDPLLGLVGFNAKEDRRHDRRTLAVDELRRLIQATEAAPPYREMTGPARALVYRLAVASGLRYAEIGSIRPESIDLDAVSPTVTIQAAYAKNGQTATLPLPSDLATDLGPVLHRLPPGRPVFPLPPGGGAAMLRADLDRAGIAYPDELGRVFDFHSLRCQRATLADQAGVSPRVIQRLMRHSSLDMTNRYTRPRMHDLVGAAAALPSPRPPNPAPAVASVTATGTDGQHINNRFANYLPTGGGGNGRNESDSDVMAESDAQIRMGRNPQEMKGLGDQGRVLTGPVASDRGGARTLDQRINVPHRLSPTNEDRGPRHGAPPPMLMVWTISSPSQACRV